ncbi:MAG TPA: carboxymuconolactone decarboxylase family protein [Mycobacterium sp.]|nr:carboxymuconolactone decarboxylase family protein [Mycobacterium sp.]
MKFVNHIEPVMPRDARGVVADVYAEARREFGRLPEPVSMLSPDEDLLAAWWASLRETLLAGEVPRARKEAVAAAVAATQRCPWCIDAHTTMLYAAGDSATAAAILADEEPSVSDPKAPYVAWARGTSTPCCPAAPFGTDSTVEYLGTAMIFHFVTRLVLVLLDETFLPGGSRAQSLARRAAGIAFARKVRANHRPGVATDRLKSYPLPDDLGWAASSPPVAASYAALTGRLEEAQHLPEPSRAVVRRAIAAWRGETMPISSGWTKEHTDGLPEELRPATRLALLTSLAPHQITDADVAAARTLLHSDAALVTGLAWSAWSAARRVAGWIARPTAATSEARKMP